ncbi:MULTISPECIES: substrate-binding domain-containing protein [unclassified Streptomyces]|uniref:substrate-binding domain-containing protein n=1 Tax=unclassified Streptomyces TaxID=2593676 RepID=UPI000F6BD957|nr:MULTISPECIES: substrate-binding domain-containing protein [unclassified Streptomyces]AZM58483.1 xylitol/threitol ABC transporter substrate-binding protein [Streptomyces sp. WAC 01438]RSM88993.1 xylitol/threitol ABC transporter substrate-binding protein [Streptomyces sp. WAC 01420]
MTRRTLRLAISAATAVALTTLAACGAGDPSADKLRVGVAVYDMSSFITQGQEGMEAYAKAHDIQLLWNSAGGDVSLQANQVERLVKADVDALVIVPVQADSLGPQVAEAKKAGIPVVAVNTALSNSSHLAATVLPDDVAAGEQEMQMMADELDGKGDIAILQGPLGSSPELDRTKGIEKVLKKYPDINVLAKDTANWKRHQAVDKVKNWLSSFDGKLDGIVAQNDDMGLGAVRALKEAGRKDIPVVGIDGIEDGLRAVQSGAFIGTSLQHGRVELAEGLAVAKRIHDEKEARDAYTYVMPPVTPTNVDTYLDHVVTGKDAFLKRLPELVDANIASGDLANEG